MNSKIDHHKKVFPCGLPPSKRAAPCLDPAARRPMRTVGRETWNTVSVLEVKHQSTTLKSRTPLCCNNITLLPTFGNESKNVVYWKLFQQTKYQCCHLVSTAVNLGIDIIQTNPNLPKRGIYYWSVKKKAELQHWSRMACLLVLCLRFPLVESSGEDRW